MGKKHEEILYEEEFRALNAAKIDYVVCGGAAVVMLGFSRLTIDLDLIVSLDKENLSRLYDTLVRLGYRARATIKKEEFIQKEKLAQLAAEKNMKVVSFYHSRDSLRTIDVGVNLPNISGILQRKRFIRVGNLKIPVIFIDDLIKMKEDLARPKDIIDAENLKRIKKIKNEKKKQRIR